MEMIRTVARPRPSNVGFLVLGLAVGGGIFSLIPVANLDPYITHAKYQFPVGCIAYLVYLALSSRIDVADGRIRLVNLLRVETIPAASIESVDYSNGIEIRTRDGAERQPVPHMSSLLQELFPSPSTRAAGERINIWLQGTATRGDFAEGRCSTKTWRNDLFGSFAVCVLTAQALGVALWVAQPKLQVLANALLDPLTR